jgi:hypothetical protein
MSEYIKTGADIANEITSYEILHEPSLDSKEYKDLVGEVWVSLSWLKEHKNFKVKTALEILYQEEK